MSTRPAEWVPQLPRGWTWTKLGAKCSIKARLGWKGLKADEYVDSGFIFLSTPNIKGRDIDYANVNYITSHRYFESPEIMVSEGDVLMAKDGSTLGTVNVVRRLPAPATVNSSLAVIRPLRDLDGRFLMYFLASHVVQSYVHRMKDGMGVPHLFQADLRKFDVICPPVHLQRAIADFLDNKTAELDALIEKKQRLVEVLDEKQRAAVNHGILRGLAPGVARRPSGVVLGELPSHWSVTRLMHLTPAARPIMYGIVLPGPNVEGGVPIVKSGNCVPEKLRLSELHRTTPEIEAGYARSRLRADDIVYAIRGSIGMAALVPAEVAGANLTQDAARIARAPGVCPRWLLYAVQSHAVWSQLEAGVVGATVKGINIRDLKRPWVPVPPTDEQAAIADHLDEVVGRLAVLMRKTSDSIERLREYRQALIKAAVTGQVDVAAQPQEAA